MALVEMDFMNGMSGDFSCVNMFYDANANYNFTGIDSSATPSFSTTSISWSQSGGSFDNPLVSFVHQGASSHTFVVTYHANCNLYNASGSLVGTKSAGTETDTALYNIGDGSRNIWFVPV